jgi:hypothetical protein
MPQPLTNFKIRKLDTNLTKNVTLRLDES